MDDYVYMGLGGQKPEPPKSKDVQRASAEYHRLEPILKSLYEEFSVLSQKKPEGVLSPTKVAVVTRLVTPCKALLAGHEMAEFLDVPDSESLPNNSDIVLMLAQYKAAMVSFRSGGFKSAEKKKKK